MSKVYFTITGLSHYYGSEIFKKNMEVKLVKETDNEYDKEAIKVEIAGLGKVGYVANSTHTVLGESLSAGRMYDKIGKKARAKVRFVTPKGIICTVKKKDLK
jgi:hypothetical protein